MTIHYDSVESLKNFSSTDVHLLLHKCELIFLELIVKLTFSHVRNVVKKIGEGLYGEVFEIVKNEEYMAIKVRKILFLTKKLHD